MERRGFLLAAAGLLGAAGLGIMAIAGRFGGSAGATVGLSDEEQRQAITALKPPKRSRPLVAIVADNRGSETTDLMIPQAVLTRSGLADVVVVAVEQAPIVLMPALSIEPQAVLAAFDRAHPDGADYVIVPAFHHEARSGPILDWLRRQAASGATVIGICEGAKVLGRAGLLDGRRATTHWYAVDKLQGASPTMQRVRDRRYVVDGRIATTTGVTASIPVSLALVEAIGGARAAAELSARLGVSGYDAAHDSGRFHLSAGFVWHFVSNSAAVWGHETVGVPVDNGVDGIALALTADAWSRTHRSKAVTLGRGESVVTADGLTLLVDRQPGARQVDLALPLDGDTLPARRLDRALSAIASRYGDGTAAFVALQLEYAWSGTG